MKNITFPEISATGCSGFCSSCRAHHALPGGLARERAVMLREELDRTQTINLFSPSPSHTEQLSTAGLFGEERGKMFGVLECCDRNGRKKWLYAFSGQYQGKWSVDGWVPPLFDPEKFEKLNTPAEKEIKNIGRKINDSTDEQTRAALKFQRKALSRDLMKHIHNLYRITNFRGMETSLGQAFISPGGKPTGTGDCCAPKLLNYAARSGLAPISIAEFFFGRRNRSRTREHGRFYPPCEDKCKPLLGFMLCGAEERRAEFAVGH